MSRINIYFYISLIYQSYNDKLVRKIVITKRQLKLLSIYSIMSNYLRHTRKFVGFPFLAFRLFSTKLDVLTLMLLLIAYQHLNGIAIPRKGMLIAFINVFNSRCREHVLDFIIIINLKLIQQELHQRDITIMWMPYCICNEHTWNKT